MTRKRRGSRRHQAPPGARPPNPRARKGGSTSVSDDDSELFRRTVGRVNPMILPASATALDPEQTAAVPPAAKSPNHRPGETPERSTAPEREPPVPPRPPLSRNLQTLAAEMSIARLARSGTGTCTPTTAWRDEHLFSRMGEGLNRKQQSRFKRGQIRPGDELDLHGLTVPTAIAELERFVAECRARRVRCVRVIHGKGFGSPGGEPRLRPAIAAWLSARADVAAYCPAQPADGGTGATYVLLKLGADAPKP